jgi:hypothetical protein
LGGENQLFIRGRISPTVEFNRKLNLRLSNRLTWFTSDGWVNESEMQWNRRMGWDLLFRSTTGLEWREDRDGVRPSQSFSLFKTFSQRRVLRFTVGGSWPEVPDPVERRYFTQLSFRRLLHSDWLFIETTPGLEWQEENDYATRMTFVVLLEAVFGWIEGREPSGPMRRQD